MPRASLLVGAAIVVGGGALAVRDLTRPPDRDATAARQLATSIDGLIRERMAGAVARARTLAEAPVLPRAVSTDANTVLNMTVNEVGFRLQPSERLEIGQVDLASKQATSLLRLPASASETPDLGSPGSRVVIQDGALWAIDVISVTPTERAAEVRGAMAVSNLVDLTSFATGPAQLAAGATTLVIGDGPLGDAAIAIPLASAPGIAVRAPSVALPRDTVTSLRGLGLAALGLLVIAGGALLDRRRPALAAVAPIASRPTVASSPPPPPSGETQHVTTTAEGPKFGRYQTLRLLGSGGMADVYLARATGEAGFARPVALKVLHAPMARRDDAVNYFLQEARLASRLLHPNIVQVIDLGKADDAYYIAMELVDGPDLDTVMRALRTLGEYMPVAIALGILRKVCDGLHVAHTAIGDDGVPLVIIHRDVKTANVLLSRQGEVKVGDFGIARAATSVRTTSMGETRGTAEFMAPEQRMGQPIDIRADVYSVAAIAYEILTSAVINLDLAALAHRGIAGWPHLPAPSTVRRDLPPGLDGIVIGALAFEPGKRPASCDVLEAQLAAVVKANNLAITDKELATWLATVMPSVRDPASVRTSTMA